MSYPSLYPSNFSHLVGLCLVQVRAPVKFDKRLSLSHFISHNFPFQDVSAAPNPYNYDPLNEIQKLGTGQLKSAYRISKSVSSIDKRCEIRSIVKLDRTSR